MRRLWSCDFGIQDHDYAPPPPRPKVYVSFTCFFLSELIVSAPLPLKCLCMLRPASCSTQNGSSDDEETQDRRKQQDKKACLLRSNNFILYSISSFMSPKPLLRPPQKTPGPLSNDPTSPLFFPRMIKQTYPDVSATSGLHSPTVMSPDGFYGGFSPSPTRPSPQKASIAPEEEDPSEEDPEKENRDPLLSLSPAADKNTSPHEAGTSKHFLGGNGSGGAGSSGASGGGVRRLSRGKRAVSSAAGLRRRFRSPLAAPSSASRATGAADGGKVGEAAKSTGGCPASGDGDDCGNNIGTTQTNPWEADFLFSARTGTRSLESTALADSGDGACVGGGGGGRGLKRRRTLGVGSLAPKGLLRGLDGVAVAGGGLAARRSKSLGGEEDGCSGNFCVTAGFMGGECASFGGRLNFGDTLVWFLVRCLPYRCGRMEHCGVDTAWNTNAFPVT